MKTEEDIRNEYVKKLTEFAILQAEKHEAGRSGRDPTKISVNVTDICAWDTYCPKQTYYNKVVKRPPLPEALIRFTIGNVAHELPLWDNEDPALNGHEQAFNWNGIRCRMDEIDIENGIILDKKTVPALSIKPKDYVVKQLNIYKVIAENNEERPIKINQLFVINLVTVNGKIQVLEVPIWDTQETIKYIERIRKEILESVETRNPPKIECGSKSWMCDSCQYTDLCKRDAPDVSSGGVPKQMVLDGNSVSGIKIRTSKKTA
jgi:hypothetical protein